MGRGVGLKHSGERGDMSKDKDVPADLHGTVCTPSTVPCVCLQRGRRGGKEKERGLGGGDQLNWYQFFCAS